MTARDFERIAAVIRAARDEPLNDSATLNRLANAFADELAKTNARFDAGRFYAACR